MLEDIICEHKHIAITQLANALKYKLDKVSVLGYEKQGCYKCNGMKESCEYYTIEERQNGI